ncbi:MAG TPA: surface lipoprotein assembly modifier [Burkholderiales bacterium]|nr:surface lipoprotein assembly modifier [Burkholderiales bacterium]
MRFTLLFAIFLLAIISTNFAYAAVAEEVKAMLEQGKAKEAYELGKQHPEFLGDPVFDFYYGVAAIDAGHAGEGVLALERYIINFPENASARLELARGYYVLGEDVRSREEFSAVLKTNPPEEVKFNIQRYLDAIRSRESVYKTSAAAFIEAGGGYDTNVNAGVSNANITLPVFGPVTVATAGVKAHSWFEYFALGGQLSQPVAPGVGVFGGGSFNAKYNNDHQDQANQFDQRNLNLNAGLSYLKNKNLYRISGFYSRIDVDSDLFLQSPGTTAEWYYQYDELQTFNTFAQYANLNYAGTNTPRSSNFYSGGLGYRKAFIAKLQPLISLGASYSRENNTEGRDDLSRNIYSGSITFGFTPFPKWAVSIGGAYQRSLYLEPDAFLLTTRADSYYTANAAISYAITPKLSAWVENLYSKNNSNISLYSYSRELASFKLRYDFK